MSEVLRNCDSKSNRSFDSQETLSKPNLPFVDAIFKEVLRYESGGPLGVPRKLDEDEMYNGECFVCCRSGFLHYSYLICRHALTQRLCSHDECLVSYSCSTLVSKLPQTNLLSFTFRAISKDPNMYPDPNAFRPQRFLPSEGVAVPTDPRLYIFGVGKRFVILCSLFPS